MLALLASNNSYISVWLRNIFNKKWTKYINCSGPKGVASIIAIRAVDQDVVVHMVDPDAAVRHGAIVVIN